MLRLTGESLRGITGYPLTTRTASWETNGDQDALRENGHDVEALVREVLDLLDDLDKAWVVILRGQTWDSNTGKAVETLTESNSGNLSQTERIRLRSLLVGGTSGLEEWLQTGGALESLDEETQGEFDDIFQGTLVELVGLSGAV